MSNETLDNEGKVPAALNLPFGQLFFGFHVTPYTPPAAPAPGSPDQESHVRICILNVDLPHLAINFSHHLLFRGRAELSTVATLSLKRRALDKRSQNQRNPSKQNINGVQAGIHLEHVRVNWVLLALVVQGFPGFRIEQIASRRRKKEV